MNIFVLDSTPSVAARYHCDKHVVKMIVESAQMLSTCHRVLRAGEGWLHMLAIALCGQYRQRYGRTHACEALAARSGRPTTRLACPQHPARTVHA